MHSATACRSCGATVTSDRRYCPSCGADASGQFPSTDRGAVSTPPPPESPWASVANRLRVALAGEFEVYGLLGQGGMAAVFLAHEYALNRKVALKVMSPALMMGDGMIERFRQEAVTQANLQHANIVAMHGVRAVDELQFFVMQFIPGRTLQQAARAERDAGRQVPVDVVRSLLFQAGSALAYAHRRGVIHRDVKPGNILLNADGDAVVTDFGIAKVAEAPGLTMTGAVVGTPAYMSPEQCFAGDLTPASDQYSLAVVAYELLAGKPPFEGPSFAVMQAHTSQEVPPIRELRPDCPEDFEAALNMMLAKFPDDRFPDMTEALQGLGARAASERGDDPVRIALRQLADVTGVEERLASILRAPPSPVPSTRRTAVQARPTTAIPEGAAPPAAVEAASLPEAATGTPVIVATMSASAPPAMRSRTGLYVGAVGGTVAIAALAYSLTRDGPQAPSTTTPAAPESTITVGGPTRPQTPPTPGFLAIVPPARTTLAPGERLVLRAQGDSLSREPVRWMSRSPRVVAIDARSGAARAVGVGDVVLVATQGTLVDSVVISVALGQDADPGAQQGNIVAAPGRAEDPVQTTAPPVVAARPVDTPAVRPSADSVRDRVPAREPPPAPVTNPVVAEPPPAVEDAGALLAGARAALGSYAAAIGSRDTAAIRRAFPTAGAQVMTRWQGLFEASERVRASISDAQPIDAFPPVPGGTARFRVRQAIAFTVRGAREQSSSAEYVATLRRGANGWTIVGVNDR